MVVRLNTSAGEFFEFIRPGAIILSGLLSTWILASARRHYPSYLAFLWAIATFAFPLIVIPIYWALLLVRQTLRIPPEKIRWRYLLPLLYAILILGSSTIYLYRQNNNVDAHLFKASQARVSGDGYTAIAEYRKALALEDNAHTHKLLATELVLNGDLEGGLEEYRIADAMGEPDPVLPFVIGSLLDQQTKPQEAAREYRRFLGSRACTVAPVDLRCEAASARLKVLAPGT